MSTEPPTSGHKLSPLLAPRSVALLGASERAGTVGDWCMRSLLGGRYTGEIYPVNPRYETLAGRRCYASLADLPSAPDLVILNVASHRLEALLDETIATGARAAVIFDPCRLEQDTTPALLQRLKDKARSAEFPICGGNGMGFYNLDTGLFASFYDDSSLAAGGITLIAHSGSVFTVLAHNDRRYRFNLVISAGQEIGTTTDEYIDYALEVPSTRVIALFIETVRNPTGFMHSLEKARAANVPVVICKVGRGEKSAKHALTHSGAIAGDHAAFVALCERFGALVVASVDDLMATAALLSQPRQMRPGGLSSLSDSGGLREHWSDLADDLQVPLTELATDTVSKLRDVLPFQLEVDNPLDAAGPLGPEFFDVFERCLPLLLNDPGTAIGSIELDINDHGTVYGDTFTDMIVDTARNSDKPFFVVNSFLAAQNTAFAQRMVEQDIPVINGGETALRAVRNAMLFRDYEPADAPDTSHGVAQSRVSHWKQQLTQVGDWNEAKALELLREFGLTTVTAIIASNQAELIEAAARANYPCVLKTANPTIAHKSDVGGVALNISNETDLLAHYERMSTTLGPKVTVQPMASAGVEVSFGCIADRQYGPIVLAGAGGLLIELLADRVCAVAPFGPRHARKLLERLAIHRLFSGARDRPAIDLDALARAFSRFSVMAATLSDELAEVDVNPLLATETGCLAVDALVIGRAEPKS